MLTQQGLKDYLAKAKKDKSAVLDLASCGLTAIPEEIFEMTWLVQLQLGTPRDPKPTSMPNLIKEIPDAISNLKALETLNLAGNKIADITPLKNCTSLINLYLSRNEISDVQPLHTLSNLEYLELENNKISDLSPLGSLTNLGLLYLTHNNITDITALGSLGNLDCLSLTGNKISNIETLRKFPRLKLLFLSENNVSDISALADLTGLTEIYLRENQIANIEPLSKLINLKTLYLSTNQISDITPLRNLKNLTRLYLTDNHIEDLSVFEDLTQMEMLEISQNQITDISPLRALLKNGIPIVNETIATGEKWIVLEENPIQFPPITIVEQGNEAVLRYFEELQKGTYVVNEARVLIVGQGGSGKTSLRKKLKDKNAEMPAPGDSTKGIEIDIVDVRSDDKDYKLHIWDFGGQNIQHYAHQFFLGDSSLYILLNNEREQNVNFQYWLNIIDMLGCKSPIMIVQNKIAGHCEAINNLAAIRAKFTNVLTTVHAVDILNAANDPKFEALRRDVTHQALSLPHIGKQYPSSYIVVRDRLFDEAGKGKHFITMAEYNKICDEEGITDREVRFDIAATFNVLGICLFFKDDIELRNYLFLNPKWVIDALFRLLYHDIVMKQKGEFSEIDVANIWYEPIYDGMHGKLLRMMEKFELCYRVKDSDIYIVPQRLPIAVESYNWNEPDVTRVEYRYKFMPKGIITRTICRLHEKIWDDHVWNDAVIFEGRKSKAFVREVYSEERIAIEATGEHRSELLNRIIDEIDDIHKKSRYENLQVEKLIPCPCDQCAASRSPYFFDYDLLCQLLDDKETMERCKQSRKMIDISLILKTTGIKYQAKSSLETRTRSEAMNRSTPYNIFISYSKEDKAHKDNLVTQLSSLKRTNSVITWDDENLVPGENWNEKIKEVIASADIILLLISANSIGTDYIWNNEINAAYERSRNRERVAIIPIIVSFCVWKDLPFAESTVLPEKGEPVNSKKWQGPDEAWANVVEGIKDVIANLKR